MSESFDSERIGLRMPHVSLEIEAMDRLSTERYPNGLLVLRAIDRTGAQDVNLTRDEAILLATVLLQFARRLPP